jgi:dsDNA-specific endonuclease/ATPase MutS2
LAGDVRRGPRREPEAEEKPGTGAGTGEAFEIPIEDAIDLHAFLPADVRDVAVEYLRAAHERGLAEVRLIHGRGRGVQRALIQQMLASLDFVFGWRDDAHLGATVVVLAPNPLKSADR